MRYALQFGTSYLVWVLLVWPFRTGAPSALLGRVVRAAPEAPRMLRDLVAGLGGVLEPGGGQDLLAGVAVAALAAAAFGRIFPGSSVRVRNPLRWFYAAAWLADLGWNAVLGALDAAWRALRPQPAPAARPAIIRVRTAVRSDAGRFALALSLGASPGLVVLDIVGQDVYLYWPEELTGSEGLRAELTVGRFEELVRRAFD